MYYAFGFSYVPFCISYLIVRDWYKRDDIKENDSRVTYLSQCKDFSCKEEIQRYLYHLDENA